MRSKLTRHKKTAETHSEGTGDKNLNQFLVRTQKTLSTRDDDKRCYVVSIPFQSEDVHQSEETIDITENLMKRLQVKVDKRKAYLANPIGENGLARPLFIDELTAEQRGKNLAEFNFSENDVLYISGHSNMVVFNGLSPSELAKHYYDFLNSSGIKEVKLAGCHTGSRFYEHNLPPLTRYKPEDLTHSYAMKFSQALVDLGLGDITVYGYRGTLSDEKKKAKFEKTAFHSYVDLYRFFPGKTTPTLDEVRGHEVSVGFKDGALVREPIITEDNILDYNDVDYTLTY